MDNFAVDLDKILDELEDREETAGAPSNISGLPQASEPVLPASTYSNGIHPTQVGLKIAQPQSFIPYDPPEALDLSEANFAPSPPKSVYNSLAEETRRDFHGSDIAGGYFIPESDSSNKNSMDQFTESKQDDYPEMIRHHQSPDAGNAVKDVINDIVVSGNSDYFEGKTDSFNPQIMQSMDPRPELVQNAIMTLTLAEKDNEDGLSITQTGSNKPSSQPDVVPIGITASIEAGDASCHNISKDFQIESLPKVHSGIGESPDNSTHQQNDNNDIINAATDVSAENRLRDFLQGKHGPHIHAGPALNLSEKAEEPNSPVGTDGVDGGIHQMGLAPETLDCLKSGPVMTDSIEGTNSLCSSANDGLVEMAEESLESQATTASCHSPLDPDIQTVPLSLEQQYQHSNISNPESTSRPDSVQAPTVDRQCEVMTVGDNSPPTQNTEEDSFSVQQGEITSALHTKNLNQNEEQPPSTVEPVEVPSIIEPVGSSSAEDHPHVGFGSMADTEEGILAEMEASVDNLPLAENMDAVALVDEIATSQPYASQPVNQHVVIPPSSLGGLIREGTVSPQSIGSGSEELVPPPVSSPERRGSGGSIERFLIPNITSPMITTPMDDTGMSKVPGFTPGLSTTSEVSEEVEEQESMAGSSSLPDQTIAITKTETEDNTPLLSDIQSAPGRNTSSGEQESSGVVRPKELPVITPTRKNRPNSLLGLSTPDLGSMAVPGAVVSSSGQVDNMSVIGEGMASPTAPPMARNDIINLQLAQQKSSGGGGGMSPMRKNQLNMEIKQQHEHPPVERVTEGEDTAMTETAPTATTPVITSRSQLALGIGMNLSPQSQPSQQQPAAVASAAPRSPRPNSSPAATSTTTSRQVQPPNSLVGLSMPQSYALPPPASNTVQVQGSGPASLPPPQLSRTDTGPTRAPPASLDLTTIPQQPGAPPQQPFPQRRPCSLNLPPRGDFQPQGSGRSPSMTPDLGEPGGAAGEDASVASSESSVGAQTPVSPEEVARAAAGASSAPVPPDNLPVPPTSANANMPITHLGKFAPIWLPDSEAPNCMQCEARFTFTKRRHHCRACGKVFCSTCCNLRSRLGYLDGKEARVCSKCYQDLIRAQVYERMHGGAGTLSSSALGAPGQQQQPQPNPNNPSEYCSTIPPLQQAQASLHAPPPTVMVPSGVLRKTGTSRKGEPKQVMFSDGIRPGGDLTELDGSAEVPAHLPMQRSGRKIKIVERSSGASNDQQGSGATKTRTIKSPEASRNVCLIPETGLPPVILQTGVKGDYSIEENPDPEKIMPQIRDTEDPTPVVFAINKNLFVIVKIVNLDCCVNRVCWSFTTKGMCTVNQAEVVIVLECLPEEKAVPRDILTHLNSVYEEASKGNTVSHLGHTIFAQPFLDSRDHGGFIYTHPSFQCQQKLILPSSPFVFGILLQKWETPWAKVFPLRLMLRLGAEFRYYPCPLISVRFRKPVYGEIGHTIMNLLADFRNYQYMLPSIKGVTVHMENKWTYINFPRNRYDQVMKVVNNSNDHVMALGSNFSTEADSHLVCIQNEDGNYQTQAINIQNKPRKVTGASFVVFNGALKTSSGLRAKSSIVEDGLMVQITAESLAALKQALKDMQDYTIGCGSVDAPQPEEQVKVQWVAEDKKVNVGVTSPIDGMSLEGIESIHIHNATDYAGDKRAIRWTECFFIKNEDQVNSRFEPVDQSRLAETLAQACCMALTRHLDELKEAGLTKIGLRATVDTERVGYETGSNGEKLPDFCMNDLDSELIPVIHNAASQTQEGPVTLELIFYIIE